VGRPEAVYRPGSIRIRVSPLSSLAYEGTLLLVMIIVEVIVMIRFGCFRRMMAYLKLRTPR
jgi:hypothetical protein